MFGEHDRAEPGHPPGGRTCGGTRSRTFAAEVREQAKKTNAVYDELLAAQRDFANRLLDVLAPAS